MLLVFYIIVLYIALHNRIRELSLYL